jgi:hypothetical protein
MHPATTNTSPISSRVAPSIAAAAAPHRTPSSASPDVSLLARSRRLRVRSACFVWMDAGVCAAAGVNHNTVY